MRTVASRHSFALLAATLLLAGSPAAHAAAPVPGTVLRAEGSEALSDLYRFEFDVLASPRIDLASVVGRQGSYPIGAGRMVHGMVTEAASIGAGEGGIVYRITLEPAAATLRYRIRSRVFMNVKVTEVVHQVLSDGGLALEGQPPVVLAVAFENSGSNPVHERIIQYEESDWAFVERLLEEAGLHYRFVHTADAHTMVISDRAPAVTPTPLSFGPAGRGGAVHELQRTFRMHSGTFTVSAYDETKENPVQAFTASTSRFPTLSVSRSPAWFGSPERAEQSAANRLAAELAEALASAGRGSASLVPGQTVRLTGHPHPATNGDYVVTSVRHVFDGTTYRNEFTWLPRNVRFVPRADTPVPRITGIQPGVVVGPEEVYVDELGRVQVRLLWADGDIGWVRVAQPSWADVRVPRVGDEVAVAFENGDPRRPVVMGALWNASDPPPYSMPEAKSVTAIRTRTTPGGSAGNELLLGDQAANQLVRLRAQKNFQTEVGGDQELKVEGTQTTGVATDQKLTVGRNQTTSVSGTSTVSIAADQRTMIRGQGSIAARTFEISAEEQIRLRVGDQYIVIDRRGVHLPRTPIAPSRTTQ